MKIVTGATEFFKGIPAIKYEGLQTDNPLAYRWYDETKVVAGKPMKDWLRFAVAYWHSFCGSGADPFGEATHLFPWDVKKDPIEKAKDKADADRDDPDQDRDARAGEQLRDDVMPEGIRAQPMRRRG